MSLLIARLFYPETFPRPLLFTGAPRIGAVTLAIAGATLAAVVLS